MKKAVWNGAVLAQSDEVVVVEGNCYFPSGGVDRRYLKPSDKRTVCPWKGTAHYYDVVVNEAIDRDAAWYYPDPKEKAAHIKDHVAFWRGVKVE